MAANNLPVKPTRSGSNSAGLETGAAGWSGGLSEVWADGLSDGWSGGGTVGGTVGGLVPELWSIGLLTAPPLALVCIALAGLDQFLAGDLSIVVSIDAREAEVAKDSG